MSEMKEVIYPKIENKYSDKECPNCKQKKLVYGMIDCPDGLVGCLVIHSGFLCYNCGKTFQ